MTAVLEISGLCKTFGEKVAVDHVDLSIPQGSFYGLVGQNGAGKTTTLSMAVGLLRPDERRARGSSAPTSGPTRPRPRRLVGVLPDGMAMPERLTGREVLTYLGLLRGLAARRRRPARRGTAVGPGTRRRPSRRWSSSTPPGCARRSGWPPPCCTRRGCWCSTSPSRPSTRCRPRRSRRSCAGSCAGGGSIVLSSHVMALVEQLCDHVAVIDKGRVAAAGPLDEVRGAGSLEDTFVGLVGAWPTADRRS